MKKWLAVIISLLTGGFFYLLLNWCLLQTIDRCTLVVKSDQDRTVTLYFLDSDETKGYQESQSTSLSVSGGAGWITLTGAIPPGRLAGLRIDPVENDGNLTISSISFSNSSFPVITMKPSEIASGFKFHRAEIAYLGAESMTLRATAADPSLILKRIPPISSGNALLFFSLVIPTVLIWSYRVLAPERQMWLLHNADCIIASLAATGTILLFFPGVMSGDSLDQWRQVLHPDQINNWHPPIMVHIWMLTNYLIPGPQGMLVFHVTLYFLSLTIFARTYFEKVTARMGYLLVIGFFPTIFLMTGAIWKDVSMLVSISLAIALLIHYVKTDRKIVLIISLLFMFYGVVVRHNAMIILIPYAFFLSTHVLGGKTNKRVSQIVATAVIVSIFIIAGKYYSAHTVPAQNKSYHIENSIFIWDMWGMSLELGERLIPPYVLAENQRMITLKEMAQHYQPYANSIIFSPLLISSRWAEKFPDAQFKKDFFLAVLDHPGAYLKVRSRVLGYMLKPDNLFGQYLFDIERFREGHYLRSYSEQLHILHPVLLHWVKTWAYWLFHHTPIFDVWIYLVLLILQLLFFSWNRTRIADASYAVTILLSGLLYWLPYFVISTSADCRYSLFTIFCALLTLPTFLKYCVKIAYSRLRTRIFSMTSHVYTE